MIDVEFLTLRQGCFYMCFAGKNHACDAYYLFYWRDKMRNPSLSMERRKFLKTGFGMSLLACFPLPKLLSFSASVAGEENDRDISHTDKIRAEIQEISLKYGGEFAGVKPELRRNNHGCV